MDKREMISSIESAIAGVNNFTIPIAIAEGVVTEIIFPLRRVAVELSRQMAEEEKIETEKQRAQNAEDNDE